MATESDVKAVEGLDRYKYGFSDPDEAVFKTRRGLNREVVEQISALKGEPAWMLESRLKALEPSRPRPPPTWGPELAQIDFDNIVYYVRPAESEGKTWEEVPETIKKTFDKLGIPEAEQQFLSGVGAQYESEMVYHNIQIDLPLQAYFRLNMANIGQFERTLIIADEGAQVHYVEGCTAPVYTTDSFHSGVIEIVVKKGARVRYTTIQNWSVNVYNLVTQRAMVHEDATMEWVDANLGSKLTMKYPSCYLIGPRAHGEILSLAFAGPGQHQDAGGKVIHAAPHTSSKITSKSISRGGGRTSYRGLLKVHKGAEGSKSHVVCDALLLYPQSRSDTYPYIEIDEDNVTIGHEASVSKIGEEQLFYLMSRGLNQEEAATMVVSGFSEPLVKELPMEYAVEMNRLIQLQMEGSIG